MRISYCFSLQMKKTNILDYFKVQGQVDNILCPACGNKVAKSKLNLHLDNSCSSTINSSSITAKNGLSYKTSRENFRIKSSTFSTSSSSRLSLKKQKQGIKSESIQPKSLNRREQIINSEVSDEVIVLDSDRPVESESISQETSPKRFKKQNIIHKRNDVNSEINLSGRKQIINCEVSDEVIVLDNDHTAGSESFCREAFLKRFKKENTIHRRNDVNSEINLSGKKQIVNCEVSDEVIIIDNDQAVENIYQGISGKGCIKQNTMDGRTDVNSEINVVRKEEKVISEVSEDIFISGREDVTIYENVCHEISEKSFIEPIIYESQNTNEMNLSVDAASDVTAILKDVKDSLNNDVFSELSDSENKELKDDGKPYMPYYIANFKHILNIVINEHDNDILFNDEDRAFIKSFESVSGAAQKLYVRLFQRKYKWLRPNKINYLDITNNPKDILEELVKNNLVDSGPEGIELETALNLLSLIEAKSLSKQFNFSSGKSKTEIISALLKHCRQHKSVFFMNEKNNITNTMLKKVKQMLGPCYRISLLPKRLFTRILMLFSLPTISDDDDEAAGGQQQQLLTLLQVNKGELTFPEYKRTKETLIFNDRDELIRYEEARQLENDIFNAVESKNFHLAKDLYIEAQEEFDAQISSNFIMRAASMPVFLKRYTSFHVYIRCMTQGVEILQRLRLYNEAVKLLKRLLKQKVFCQDYRGRWWDRLALNLEQHLKKPQEAIEAIKEGLQDKNVRVGHRYSLLVRALRILKSTDENDEFKKEILKAADVIDAPKVTIRGRLFPKTILGRRHVFISSSATAEDNDDITVLGVEALAIEHYKSQGFTEGVHGEGSTFISLYALLFWDIIYDGSIPDVFISPYQTHPLDLNSDSFFHTREKQILSHLENMRLSTTEDLKEIVKTTWENHFGKSSLVSWDRFTDVEHVKGLVACMGNNLLCGICERLARDFRFTRSGVPDLVVWNPETLLVKIVEVKGPGDKLSSKQILWLDYLIKLGADAEVCLVEAVGSKKLRKE